MIKNKRFIIDIGEPQHENAFFEYKEHFDDYDFVCWVDDFDEILKKFNELGNENEQLKQEIAKFKEWEKYIGDVKREDLDRVFKMSIYEIAEAFEYYRKRIKELEE